MAIISTLLKKGILLKECLEQEYAHPLELRRQGLKELLITASETDLGKAHHFPKILNGFRDGETEFYEPYEPQVTICHYDRMTPSIVLEFLIQKVIIL